MKKPSFYIYCVLAVLILSTLTFTISSVKNSQNNASNSNSKIILEVWQIDMFEGGTGSRKNFLLSAAENYEKINENVMVSVFNETVDSAKQKMENNIYPDIISYSNGIEGVLAVARELPKTLNGTSYLSYGGNYNGKNYAIPWCVGGYVLLTKQGVAISSVKKLYVSQAEFSLPMCAYYLSNYRFEEIIIKTPKNAYAEFVMDNQNTALLGTQRDLYRLTNRSFAYEVTPLNEFSDLIQYASIITDKTEKYNEAVKYLGCLLEYSNKNSDKIGMLNQNRASYSDILNPLKSEKIPLKLSVFTSAEAIKDMQKELSNIEILEEQKINNIKNIAK